jgi:cytochrome oxidase Cu insertion factor (SCO1/SenC/PrrC family)
MTRRFSRFALLAALAVTACAQKPQSQQSQPPAPGGNQSAQTAAAAPTAAPKTHLKVGDPAPDFTLSNTKGEKVSLSDFRGKKNVVLAFYVLAFTGG